MEVQVQVQKLEELSQEEGKEENEILLDLEEKEVESKPNLDVVPTIVPHSHSYALHCPN